MTTQSPVVVYAQAIIYNFTKLLTTLKPSFAVNLSAVILRVNISGSAQSVFCAFKLTAPSDERNPG